MMDNKKGNQSRWREIRNVKTIYVAGRVKRDLWLENQFYIRGIPLPWGGGGGGGVLPKSYG